MKVARKYRAQAARVAVELEKLEQRAGLDGWVARAYRSRHWSARDPQARIALRDAYFSVTNVELRRQLIAKHREFDRLIRDESVADEVEHRQKQTKMLGRGASNHVVFLALSLIVSVGVARWDDFGLIGTVVAGVAGGAAYGLWREGWRRHYARDIDRLTREIEQFEIERRQRDSFPGDTFDALEEESSQRTMTTPRPGRP